jgi:hypothetical protein
VDHEAEERRAVERARSLRDELPIIVGYPFVDVVAYVLLVVVVWLAMVARGFALFGGGVAVLFSQGLLLAYAFTAINRVSSGNLRTFTPDISDITALIEPLRLSLGALLVSSAPLLLLVFLYPSAVPRALHLAESAVSMPVARAEDAGDADTPAAEASPDAGTEAAGQSKEVEKLEEKARSMVDGEGVEPGAPIWVLPLMALALLWKVVYSPIALAVAAISRSFVSTINPVVGVGCIRSMGSVYWEAMGIYTVVVAIQAALGLGLGLIPLLGTLARAFVDAYAYLVVGCTLGFAVFKKARELGME